MVEPPRPAHPDEPTPARCSALDLQLDGRSMRVQRLDARAAVDVARRQNIAARHALVAASSARLLATGPPGQPPTAPPRSCVPPSPS